MMNSVTKQNGAALVVGLIMLLVMTLMGVTSMNTTRTELKIANNLNNHSTAFQTAALLVERILVDPAIIWSNADMVVPQTGSYPAGYTSGDGLRAGTASLLFVGCRASAGASITGHAGKTTVHELSVAGNAVNSNGDVVGVSRQRGGFATTAAGCSVVAP